MQQTLLTLSLAAAAAAATTYPIKADVNCRSGPSTISGVVKTYTAGDQVALSCQIPGDVVSGDKLWDKTTDGCYVSDYYVSTGTSNMVTGACDTGDDGSSTLGGSIKREEVIARGKYWINLDVPYSMSADYPDPQGLEYRTDCSGFVSMALHASAPGYTTVSILDVVTEIDWDDLELGDLVGTLGDATGGAGGHVVLFNGWTDSSKTLYNTLECRGTAYGCVAYQRGLSWTDGGFTSYPYRYNKIVD